MTAAHPALDELISTVHLLRAPGGCPWDAKQSHDSLRQYLVEETYELLDAIEQGDRESLREELGDVLLQVLFHTRIAAEHAEDPFDIDELALTARPSERPGLGVEVDEERVRAVAR